MYFMRSVALLKRYFLLMITLLLTASSARADVLILNNGKKLRGKIIEEKLYSVVFDRKGIINTYYKNEIKEIIRDKPKKEIGISEKKKALILRLLEVNGAKAAIQLKYQTLLDQYAGEALEEVKAFVSVDEIIEMLVPIYARYYTEGDLVFLIEFYASPAGSKHLKITPQVMEDSMTAMMEHFSKKISDGSDKEEQ